MFFPQMQYTLALHARLLCWEDFKIPSRSIALSLLTFQCFEKHLICFTINHTYYHVMTVHCYFDVGPQSLTLVQQTTMVLDIDIDIVYSIMLCAIYRHV